MATKSDRKPAISKKTPVKTKGKQPTAKRKPSASTPKQPSPAAKVPHQMPPRLMPLILAQQNPALAKSNPKPLAAKLIPLVNATYLYDFADDDFDRYPLAQEWSSIPLSLKKKLLMRAASVLVQSEMRASIVRKDGIPSCPSSSPPGIL